MRPMLELMAVFDGKQSGTRGFHRASVSPLFLDEISEIPI